MMKQLTYNHNMIMIVDTRLLADTADYVNPDLPTVSPKKQYHVIVTADGSLYTEWQLRVVRMGLISIHTNYI